MHVTFFTNQGPAIQIAVPKFKTANAKFFKGKVLHKLKKYFKNSRPSTGPHGVRLLHDNASSQKAVIYKNITQLWSFLTLLICQILPLVTYLYPRLKKNLLLERNTKRKKLILYSAIFQSLKSIP
jgi:hypothetical protein